ncbi:MAG TPA: DUF4231 domain-containing protein [Bryobacteraceae bacterium]|jgi:hypothetical protein|nr:DUF4231 domain-containing protein [Bryobacteraceae bacterium]
MPESTVAAPGEQITLARLDDQIAWYAHKSALNQRRYKFLKLLTIASAAVIPVVTTAHVPYGSPIAAGLGVLIAITEGIQQLNQYNVNWTSYRNTAESLKHEKFLYLARAGPYRTDADAQASLAERVEALVSQEESKWLTVQSSNGKDGFGRSLS